MIIRRLIHISVVISALILTNCGGREVPTEVAAYEEKLPETIEYPVVFDWPKLPNPMAISSTTAQHKLNTEVCCKTIAKTNHHGAKSENSSTQPIPAHSTGHTL